MGTNVSTVRGKSEKDEEDLLEETKNYRRCVREGQFSEPVFILCHDNAIDCNGRSVCKRVARINSLLVRKGVRTLFWNYEETQCDNNHYITTVSACMEREDNICFILFLTRQYVTSLLTVIGAKTATHSKFNNKPKHSQKPSQAASYLDSLTIDSIIERYRAGNCRIVPVLMEECALEPASFYDYSTSAGASHNEMKSNSFGNRIKPLDNNDIAVRFVWKLDYSSDTSFPTVTRQMLRIIHCWTRRDKMLFQYDMECQRERERGYRGVSEEYRNAEMSEVRNEVEYGLGGNAQCVCDGLIVRNPYVDLYCTSNSRNLTLHRVDSKSVGDCCCSNNAFTDTEVDLVGDTMDEVEREELYNWLYKYFNKKTLQREANTAMKDDAAGTSATPQDISQNSSRYSYFNTVDRIFELLLLDGVSSTDTLYQYYVDCNNSSANSHDDDGSNGGGDVREGNCKDSTKNYINMYNVYFRTPPVANESSSNTNECTVIYSGIASDANNDENTSKKKKKKKQKGPDKENLNCVYSNTAVLEEVGNSRGVIATVRESDRGNEWLAEVMTLQTPSIHIIATIPPAVRRGVRGLEVPNILEEGVSDGMSNATYTRINKDDSVLYGLCPTVLDGNSSLQEIGLVFQICIQAVATHIASSDVNRYLQREERLASEEDYTSRFYTQKNIPFVQQQEATSNVVLSAIPTLSYKHPLNRRLRKIQGIIVSMIYGETQDAGAIKKAQLRREQKRQEAIRGQGTAEEENGSSTGVSIDSKTTPEAIPPLGGFGGSGSGEANLYIVANFLLQGMQELALRFVTYVGNRCIAAEAGAPPMDRGATVGTDTNKSRVDGSVTVDEYLSKAIKNPIEEFCVILNGGMLMCDTISAYVNITRMQIWELEFRGRLKARKIYNLNYSNADRGALKDDGYLEDQRKYLYDIFVINSLVSLCCMFSGLSVAYQPLLKKDAKKGSVESAASTQSPLRQGEILSGGDWYYDDDEEGNVVYGRKKEDVFNEPAIKVDKTETGNQSLSILPLNDMILRVTEIQPQLRGNIDAIENSSVQGDENDSDNASLNMSALIKLIYSHNANNIFACCNHTICDGVIALVKPSILKGPSGEMICILYNTVLQHISSTDMGRKKLGIANVSKIIQYMVSIYTTKCCVNLLISWPSWLVSLFQYTTLYNTIWIVTSNLCMNEVISRIRVSSSTVLCEHMIISLCHGFQILFQYYEEVLELCFNVSDSAAVGGYENPATVPLKTSGTVVYYEVPLSSSVEASHPQVQESDSSHLLCHLSKEEAEMTIYNILLTIYYISIINDDPMHPIHPASSLIFEELISFDVMRSIVKAFHNNLTSLLAFINGLKKSNQNHQSMKSIVNSALDRIRQMTPANNLNLNSGVSEKGASSSSNDTCALNVHSLYILVGVCKAIHGLCSQSNLLKMRCIDNGAIKVLSNALCIVYTEEHLLIELLPPMITLLLINNDSTVLLGDSRASIIARRRLYTQFCRGSGHNYIVSALESYFDGLVSKQPLVPGFVDTTHTIVRDLLMILFWVMYHGNDNKTTDPSAAFRGNDTSTAAAYEQQQLFDHAEEDLPAGTYNTAALLTTLCTRGINEVISKMLVSFTNRLLSLTLHLTVSDVDECSVETRNANDGSLYSSNAEFDTVKGDSSVISSFAQAAMKSLAESIITEEELCLINIVDYICKILCYLVTEEHCRILLGTSDGFCQSLLNVLTLSCKLMMVYENVERNHLHSSEDPEEDAKASEDEVIEGTEGIRCQRGITMGERKRRHRVFKSSLIYIIGECCFIFRALCVDSCNQSNILKQPIAAKTDDPNPSNISTHWSRSGNSSCGDSINSGVRSEEFSQPVLIDSHAAPYSSWYKCILSVIKLYMYIHTIPLPRRKAIIQESPKQLVDEALDKSSECTSDFNNDDGIARSDTRYYAKPHVVAVERDEDDVTRLSQASIGSQGDSLFTTTFPVGHNTTHAGILDGKAINDPAAWATSISDSSFEHLLNGALSLTCGISVSAAIMKILFVQFADQEPQSSSLATEGFNRGNGAGAISERYTETYIMIHLFKQFIVFTRLFTLCKVELSMLVWEILRRQFVIWLFPYHNTNMPDTFRGAISTTNADMYSKQVSASPSTSNAGGASLTETIHKRVAGSPVKKKKSEDVYDVGSMTFDHDDANPAVAANEIIVQDSSEKAMVAQQNGSGVSLSSDEASPAYHMQGYKEKLEEDAKIVGYEGKRVHHNNNTASSMKFLASLRPSLSIATFMPFTSQDGLATLSTDGRECDDESTASRDSGSACTTATTSTASTSLLGKFSAWFNYSSTGFGVGIKGKEIAPVEETVDEYDYHSQVDLKYRIQEQNKKLLSRKKVKGKGKVKKYGDGSVSSSKIAPSVDSVAGHNIGTTVIGAVSVSNKFNPVHIILWSFRDVTTGFDGILAPANAKKLNSKRDSFDVCIYDTLYYVLAVTCGQPGYSRVTIVALQVLIVIMQGYVHDKKAYQQLCNLLHVRKMFDILMKYLLIVQDPFTYDASMESVASRLSSSNAGVNTEEGIYNMDKNNEDSAVKYKGQSYAYMVAGQSRYNTSSSNVSLRDIGVPGVTRKATSQTSLSSALPCVNHEDLLSSFVDRIDCGFSTVRSICSVASEPPPWQRNQQRYGYEDEMDIIKYICSVCSYAAVDENTRYILKSVLYTEQILLNILELPRYGLPLDKMEPIKQSVATPTPKKKPGFYEVFVSRKTSKIRPRDWEEGDEHAHFGLQHRAPVADKQTTGTAESIQPDYTETGDRWNESLNLSSADKLPLTPSPILVEKIEQIHKVICVVFDNIQWKDTRSQDYKLLEKVVMRMNSNFDNLNVTNATKEELLNAKYFDYS